MTAFSYFNAREREGLMLLNRRGMLKTSLAGMAGLTLPDLLRLRSEAAKSGRSMSTGKSVILLWMAGGPSHIDTLDPKPNRPPENRGPFGVTASKLPGIYLCEHLPKQAALLDKMTIIRSVDARNSNHQPNKVFQTGHLGASPRTNPKGDTFPSIASVIAKMHGANHPSMPPYIAFIKHASHVGLAGHLGKQYDPFKGNDAADLPIYTNVGVDTGRRTGARMFHFTPDLNHQRIRDRLSLMKQIDRLRGDLDQSGSMDALDSYTQQAIDLITGGRAQKAFDLRDEPQRVRQRYGKHLWCQQALLARRLVEAGSAFITLDLSHHTASGTWDTHGDNIPPYGGIKSGLGPLLPLFDHLLTTLISDLDERGMLDDVLVIAMGEFGRTPQIGTQGSVGGRNHWPVVMSMTLAGGGLRHGQVIGASEQDGGQIKERPVTPGDLAATIYRHMGVPLNTAYLDPRGRPNPVVVNGAPIRELF